MAAETTDHSEKTKVRVPVMIQDPSTSRSTGEALIEHFEFTDDFFLDGPVSRRVAVLDFDPETGALHQGAQYVPPSGNGVTGHYEMAKVDGKYDIYAPSFIQTSVFATVQRTMQLFEERDTLGRPLTWAFPSHQLLVVPRAGRDSNAFYERDSHSLQFFSFPNDDGQNVHTSLSRDIVAHETGHAILDGIAPDLYNSVTPQSLALHEAIADLTAVLMAFRSRDLIRRVLSQTNGSILNSTAFSSIAEQFGGAHDPQARTRPLRNLLNERTLDPSDTSRDEHGERNLVARNEPHALSEVISGALYKVLCQLHESYKETEPNPAVALATAVRRFKRTVFRALDYLPPGEVSFADYGRAIIAADQAAHPDKDNTREWLSSEFVRRQMAPDLAALKVDTNIRYPPLETIDLQTLVESEWAAYAFANDERNREFLRIPPGVPFRIRPRLDVTKRFYAGEGAGAVDVRECIFKVSWDRREPSGLPWPYPPDRVITDGTTLAIDWNKRTVRARMPNDLEDEDAKAQLRDDRDRFLQRLDAEGVLQLGPPMIAPDGKDLRSVIRAQVSNDLMRVRGAARTLHIAEG